MVAYQETHKWETTNMPNNNASTVLVAFALPLVSTHTGKSNRVPEAGSTLISLLGGGLGVVAVRRKIHT